MTEKRFSLFKIDNNNYQLKINNTLECGIIFDDKYIGEFIIKELNELHEENQLLKFANKELIRFITSKGYTLQDYIKFIGQCQSIGVNKEDWK